MTDDEYIGWFECLGKTIPDYRIEAAREQAEQMGIDDVDIDIWIRDIVKHIERDRPSRAIDRVRDKLDLSGAYRLLAYLCTAREPNKTNEHPNMLLVNER